MRLRELSNNTALQIQDGGRRHIGFLINANDLGLDGQMLTNLDGIIPTIPKRHI